MRKATTSVDDEPCDYQKAGSSLVPGAVESDRDVTFLGTSFFGGTGKLYSSFEGTVRTTVDTGCTTLDLY